MIRIIEYIIIILLLFSIELFYFKIAKRFNIQDVPNKRSSHRYRTIRGGGIIFYISLLIFFIASEFSYPYYFAALTLIAGISFMDDISNISYVPRLIAQLIASVLLLYQLDLFAIVNPIFIIPLIILIIGIANVYNFMDGINGMTALYSLILTCTYYLLNQSYDFINPNLLLCLGIGIIIFGFFNFRTSAKCFAGDVGSMTMGIVQIFILGKLIVHTENFIYILFLTIYGIESGLTILRRIINKENILKPHRSHLFQLLVNEMSINMLFVSAIYGILQMVICILTIFITSYSKQVQIVFGIILVSLLSFIYLYIKKRIYLLLESKDIKVREKPILIKSRSELSD